MVALGTGLKPGVATHHDVALGSNRLDPAALGAMIGKWWYWYRHDVPQESSIWLSLPLFDIDGRSIDHRLSAISAFG